MWRVAHGCAYQGRLRGADLAAYQDRLGCGSGESVLHSCGGVCWVWQFELLIEHRAFVHLGMVIMEKKS